MRTFLSTLAAAILLVAPAVHAAETWQLGDYVIDDTASGQRYSLVSQRAGETVISLDSFAAATAGLSHDAAASFGVTIPEGVVVTKLTMTAYVKGTGRNAFSVSADVHEVDMYNAGVLHAPLDLEGRAVARQDLIPVFADENTFDLKGYVTFSLNSYEYGDVEAERFTLTFQTSPVPEPGTWLMLGGGLAIVGGAAALRRRV